MQVVNITTKQFSGDMLVMNNEHCGKTGKGGVSLYDVTNPKRPRLISERQLDVLFPQIQQTALGLVQIKIARHGRQEDRRPLDHVAVVLGRRLRLSVGTDPDAASIPGYLGSLQSGEEKIVLLQRGPAGDPSAPRRTRCACRAGAPRSRRESRGATPTVAADSHAVYAAPRSTTGAGRRALLRFAGLWSRRCQRRRPVHPAG
jgi:hypothetical protein